MTTQIDPRVDLYKTLGVSQDASADEIKKAYRRLAKEYHPDRTGGDKAKESRFKEISQAYDVLGDASKRKQYDALRAGGGRFAGGGFPGGFSAEYSADQSADLGEIFAQMFGSGPRRKGGSTRVRFSQGGFPGAGGGFPFGAEVPFGSESPFGDGDGSPGAPPAERQVSLSDGSSAIQRGANIYSDVRIRIDQAILGTVVDVPTLSGTSKVKIPPGTSSGVKLRLKGKGARNGQGDHYVTVHIDVPKQLDEQAKKLLVELMQRVR